MTLSERWRHCRPRRWYRRHLDGVVCSSQLITAAAQFIFEKGGNQFGLVTTSAGILQARMGGTTNIPKQSSGNWSRTEFVMVTASRVSSTCNGFVNGSDMTTTGTTTLRLYQQQQCIRRIGATHLLVVSPLIGDIAEILVGGATLSTEDRQKIEGYLAHRYGLEGNLPSDHPYKSAAPTTGAVRSLFGGNQLFGQGLIR